MLRSLIPLALWVCAAGAAPAQEAIDFSSLVERLVDYEHAYEEPPFRVGMVSSFDRDGGGVDDSGFIRKDGGWFVAAEFSGPGAVTRIWSANPQGMVRIYVDDLETPLIQCNFRDLFMGDVAPFKPPLVRGAPRIWGAHWSHVPIPFQEGCRIALSAQCYYQVDYALLPIGARVRSLTLPLPKDDQTALARTAKAFDLPAGAPYKVGGAIKRIVSQSSIKPRQRAELASIDEGGVIRGLRLKWQGERDDAGRDMMIYAFWDGEEQPSIQSPLFDFFGGRVKSIVLGRDEKGWRYCYLPMPFNENARIEIENGSTSTTYTIEAQVDWQAKDDWPVELRRFHAEWRRWNDPELGPVDIELETGRMESNPADNYIAAAIEGRGHLAGATVHRFRSPESDTMFFVDGDEWPPVGHGAGNTGFFNLAWDAQTVSWPLSAAIVNLYGMNGYMRILAPFPVKFDNRLVLSFERGHANAMRQDYSSTVYWYQIEPHRPFSHPLPAEARAFRKTAPISPEWRVDDGQAVPVGIYEGESAVASAAGGFYEPQDMTPYGPDWSGGRQLKFDAIGPHARLELAAPSLTYSGYYTLTAGFTGSPASAILSLELNNRQVLPYLDLYKDEIEPYRVEVSPAIFLHASESLAFSMTVLDRHPSSEGYEIGLDYLHWSLTETIPETLTAIGPYQKHGAESVSQPPEPLRGSSYSLGFTQPGQTREITYQADEDKRFRLTAGDSSEGVLAMNWTIQAPQSGVYRFEVDPVEALPFLLEWDPAEKGLVERRGWLLVNGIPARTSDERWLDADTLEPMPQRFSLPLAEGDNRLQWMAAISDEVLIQPRIYGISEETGKKDD